MFQNTSSSINDLKKIPSKSINTVFSFFVKNTKLTNLFIYIHTIKKIMNINFLKINCTLLLLSIFFLKKTYRTKLLRFVLSRVLVSNTLINVLTKKLVNRHSRLKVSNFDKKCRTLYRPARLESPLIHVLSLWRKKYELLRSLGFFKLWIKYVIVKINSNKLIDITIVKISSCLILSPKYIISSINKHITLKNSKYFELQFCRKNKIYNKGRYSRCRQNYRTGVYMCIYLSIISIFGLYFWFYRFLFNFSYLWWLFITLLGSFLLPKIFKYNIYDFNSILISLFGFLRWLFLLIKAVFF